MFIRIILIILSVTLLSGCANFSLKRSANNKLVDMSGFEGGKRRPVYNKKYISRAKHNVMEQNYDDDIEDEDSESISSTSLNRSMYQDMVERDKKRKAMRSNDPKMQKYQKQSLEYNDSYEDLSKSKNSIENAQNNGKTSQDMQKELSDIKKMLAETKKDMAKYRCPMQQTQNKGSSATSLSNSIGVGGQ